MGAKDWMVMYTDGNVADVLRTHPRPDREASRAVIERLHPGARLTPLEDGNLGENCAPANGEAYAGVYPGLTIVVTGEAGRDRPSTLPGRFVEEANGRKLYLHAMHSVVDWFAYGVWQQGTLQRALSLSSEGIVENVGEALDFEKPYWAGEHPQELDEDEEPYPFVFHPLELGEAALRNLFGFNYEGLIQDDDPDPYGVTLIGYRLS